MHHPPRTVRLLVIALLLIAGSSPVPASAAVTLPVRAFLPMVSCAGCPGEAVAPTPGPNPTPPPVDEATYEAQVIALVNQARVAAGCPAALPNAALMEATGTWSAYMDRTGDYSHGTYAQFQQKYAAYPGWVLENIAGGIATPELVVATWSASPQHQRNMLFCYQPTDPSYNPARQFEIGVGYVNGYWTLALGDYTY
ncbi:MAG: CAP domain-containing protein [Chloroflexales bacterium]|nr:CAP domain-containing protein [Chloroflexales bacterium]